MKTAKIFSVIITLLLCYPFNIRCTTDHADTTRSNKVILTFDTSEADEVISILLHLKNKDTISSDQWQKLFDTFPYKRLKERQASIAKRFHDSTIVLKDDDFKDFINSEDLVKRAENLKVALENWKKADLYSSALSILKYLPDSAVIQVKIYPVIKSGINSFVWDMSSDPTIFLYLDPDITTDEFTNTVMHEFHHIGLSSINSGYNRIISSLSEKEKIVADWIGAFGEGMAMLAAAGSPDIHPHASSNEKDRTRWDHDMTNFTNDLKSVDSFFVNILKGKFTSEDSIDEKGSSYFGIQGPWYTVGYKMCVMVEKHFDRSALIRTMQDPRQLLVLYNQAAKEENASGKDKLPLWSESIIYNVCTNPGK